MVTTRQLHAAELDKDAIARRVQEGSLYPVFDSVYSLTAPPFEPRQRWMAATLTYGPGTRLAASPAAELYGWPRYPLGGPIHVQTPTPRKPRDGIVPHHRTDHDSFRIIDFIPVTGPEQTLLDCALTVPSDKAYRRLVRQAQVDEDTTYVRLVAFAAQHAGTRGIARLRGELADGPSPTRSAFEDEVDLYFEGARTVVEVMGAPHDNPTARADDVAKKARLEALDLRVLWLS